MWEMNARSRAHIFFGEPYTYMKGKKQIAMFFNEAVSAFSEFVEDVKTRAYLTVEEHSIIMKDDEYERFLNEMACGNCTSENMIFSLADFMIFK